ncbi:hypothetical protein BDW75DRAFT_197383 [Aspergillus navahoensis]
MGNMCSSSKNHAEPGPSSRPGRVLGSNTANSATRASVPATAKSKPKSHFESPGRTLGGGVSPNAGAGSSGTGTESGAGSVEDTNDARAKAAMAAQVGSVSFLYVFRLISCLLIVAWQKRAEASGSANKGKLGSKLVAQRAQTQAQTLNEVSREERAVRDADGAAAARRWD